MTGALPSPGPDYSFDYESSGGLFFDSSWEGGYQSSQNQAEGIYLAEVDPASDAVLLDGTVCFSGGPVDAEYLTVPKAACLNNEPVDAVASGTGWISNTTQPVAHRNKTMTPPGPAGVRPTLATACLTNRIPQAPQREGTSPAGGMPVVRRHVRARDHHRPVSPDSQGPWWDRPSPAGQPRPVLAARA